MLNYKIKKIDNFLSNQDFKDLNEISSKIKENDKKDFDIYHNEVDSNGKIIKSTINKDLLLRIYKNYFFGNLRFKLNPYIFRYFKNTIQSYSESIKIFI